MVSQLEELLSEEPDIWSVQISFTTADPDNETMTPFLSAMGYMPEDDMGRNIYAFTLEQLGKAKAMAKPASKSLRIRSFSQLSEDVLRAVQKRGIAMETPLPEDTLNGSQVEKELSHAMIKDGKIEAYAAVDHSCCGVLTLCALKGVDSDHLRYMTNIRDKSQLQVYEELLGAEKVQLRYDLMNTKEAEQISVKPELERRMAVEKENLMRGAAQMKEQAETMKGDLDIGGLGLTGFVTGYSFDELATYRKMIEDHPTEYAKNPQLIDALYQGMYRVIDALGDVTLQSMAAQGVIDAIKQKSLQMTATDSSISDAAEVEMEKPSKRADAIRGQLASHEDAFLSLLLGKPLTDSGADLIRQIRQ